MRSLRFLPWRDRQSRCDDVSAGAHTAKERPRSTHDHPTFPCSRIDRFIHLPSSSPFFRQLAGGSFWSRSGSKLLLLVAASFVDDCMISEEHTSELQSLISISYAVFCLNTTL